MSDAVPHDATAARGGAGRASRLLLWARKPSARQVLAAASACAGLDDFGDTSVHEGLERLLEGYRTDNRQNLLGRAATHWDNMRLLTNLLILREREKADPSVLERPIAQPIFIMGLPRSGTSFLHRLLSLAPGSRAPLCWEVISPYPNHALAGRGAGPRKVERQLRLFQRLVPELKRVHPLAALAPQECGDILAHSFQSARFDATYDVPSYGRWVKRVDATPAFRLHKRFLQHLQGEQPCRWVLKWPDHIFTLDALRRVYPDALIVFCHRDPVHVMPSLARLTELMRRPFVRGPDRLRLAQTLLQDWSDGVGRMIAEAASPALGESRTAHVHFKSLARQPVETVAATCARLGLPFDQEFKTACLRLAASAPNGGYGRNIYRADAYGLEPHALRRLFQPYTAAFGIEEEAPTG